MAVKGKAEKKSKKFKKKRTSTRPEIGASGVTNFFGTIDTDEYVTDLTGSRLYTTVDKMRWSDASVQAALLMCELPIRSAEWDIEPASEEGQDVEIAEFVKDNLFNGLVVPWEDTLRQILLMHPYGVMIFEVVYKLTEDGRIGWRKWAPRLPKTIEKWHTDKNGELEKVEQRAYKDDNYIVIEIPAEKLMVFVHRREGDNYLGTSILRQAYKHWFFRDKYYKIDAVAQERLGIGVPLITLPDGYTDDDYDEAKEMGENFRGHEKAYVVKKTGFGVELLDLKNSSTRDPMPMLEHHTREILKSVLAQFVDLGSKSVGSYALAKEQTETFLAALDASAKIVEDVINKEIQKLVDYNWTVDKYPKLTHSDLGTRDFKELAEAIQTLSFAQAITPDPELEDYLRKVMKLPEKSEEGEGEDLQRAAKPDREPEEPEEEEETFSERLPRPLTKAEQRVKFDEIRDFMDAAEREVVNKMISILTREKNGLMPLFESAIRRKDFADLQKISWKLKSVYAALFKEQIKKLFEFGKLRASYEIKRPAPVTPSELNQVMTERAFYLASRHEKQMLEELKGIAAVGMMDDGISDVDTVEKVKEGFAKFNNKNVPATASLLTAGEINNGRKLTFDSFKNDIYGYQWSAILDTHTCNYCRSADGRIIGVEDKAFSEYKPGEVHFNCRCIWVAIMKEEETPPPFTGMPATLRPQSQMPTWEFKDLEYPLPDSGKRRMPYGVGVFDEFGNLPKDTIWRTIGGKRVPISPKTGKPVERGNGKQEKLSRKEEEWKKVDEELKKKEKELQTRLKRQKAIFDRGITQETDPRKEFGDETQSKYAEMQDKLGYFQMPHESSKKQFITYMKKNPDVREYGFFDLYTNEKTSFTFDEWLNTETTVYRGQKGTYGSKYFKSFTTSKKVAEYFAKEYGGKVISTNIKPIEAIGARGWEGEILVRTSGDKPIPAGFAEDKRIDEFAKYLHNRKKKSKEPDKGKEKNAREKP